MVHTLIIYVIILLDRGGDGENHIDVNDDSVTAARNEVSCHLIASWSDVTWCSVTVAGHINFKEAKL